MMKLFSKDSINKSENVKKKNKGVILLRKRPLHVIKGLKMKVLDDTMSQSNQTNQENCTSFSYASPISTGETPKSQDLRREDSIIPKRLLFTATSQVKKTRPIIQDYQSSAKKQPTVLNNTSPSKSSSITNKDLDKYHQYYNKTPSYTERVRQCISRNIGRKKHLYNSINSTNRNSTDIIKGLYTDNFVKKSFATVEDHLTKTIKNNKTALNHYINIETTQTEISVTNNNYDSNLKYPIIYCNLRPQTEKTFTPATKFSFSTLTNKFPLRKEVTERLKSIKREETLTRKKEQLSKWKKVIINSAIEFRGLHVDLSDFVKFHKKTVRPYEHFQSYDLFQAIKHNDKKYFLRLVFENYCVIFDYDRSLRTVLHWMAKRNRYTWISYTVHSGACVNSKDCIGRTPLHLAAAANHIQTVQILLYEMANPFIQDNKGFTALDLTSDPKIKFIINRVILLYAIHSMGKSLKFEAGIKRGLLFLYNFELKTTFTIRRYCIIESKYLTNSINFTK